MSNNSKVKIIPCSGMGKVYGLMSREAVLQTVTKLCPEQAETICLAYIVTGDKEAEMRIANQPCLTIDGCPMLCAAKSVAAMGGDVKEQFKVLDVVKEHRGVQPGTATALTDGGWMIVDDIAARLATKVCEVAGEGKKHE